ncbi:MAG: hypothetical protein AAF916_10270 [Planctomycetota bacterium]
MSEGLTPEAREALTKAGLAWASFVAGILVMLMIVLLVVGGNALAGGWLFALAATWTLLAVPAALLVKGQVVKAAWSSRPTDPEAYLRSLMVVWGAIEIGAVLALIGCLFSGALMPGGLLAGVLLAMLFLLRPSEEALGTGLDGGS